MKSLKHYALLAFVSVTSLLTASLPASATGVADLTAAISFTDVVAAVVAIGVLLAGLFVTIKGIKIVIGMLKGS